MKLHTILLIMSLSAVLFSQGQRSTGSQNTNDKKAVLQTERELLQAFIQGDRNTLDRLLADNYHSYNNLAKQEIINDLRPMTNTSVDTSQLKVRLFGDSAEVTAILLEKWRGGVDVYSQVIDRLVKHPIGWRSVSSNKEMMPIWEGKLFKDSEMALITPLSCNERSNLKSLNSEQPAMLKFTNAMAQPVIIHWINYDGELDTHPDLVNTILPGKSMAIMTFVTHPFLVTDEAGTCLHIFKPNPEPSLAIIK